MKNHFTELTYCYECGDFTQTKPFQADGYECASCGCDK